LACNPLAGEIVSLNDGSSTAQLYQCTGVDAWTPVPLSAITGTGAAGRIALWSGASSQTSNAGLTYSGSGATLDLTLGRDVIAGRQWTAQFGTVTPLSDLPTLTLRRFSSAQTNNIFQAQTEGNVHLFAIQKDGSIKFPDNSVQSVAGVAANAAITGATKTKISYDSKGLVTAGADIAAGDLPTGIDAAKVGGGAVSNTEFGYLDGVTSALQTQIDGKQASLGFTPENSANKDAASGYAGLTAGSLLKAAEFPVLTGDITTPGGVLATTLKATGTAGTYRSVTFDAQGRETSGTNPTTFSGYAISDTSANLRVALTDENGTGPALFDGATATTLSSSAGVGTGTFNSFGAINTQTSSSGIGNGADTTDDTLFTYAIPLNSLSANGKSFRVVVGLQTAANGNNKRIKLTVGGTAVLNTGTVTWNILGVMLVAECSRLDSTHVLCLARTLADSTLPGVGVTPSIAVSDLSSNTLTITATGASPTTGAANDVKAYLFKVWFEN
jgi:hypothetical protein